MRETSGGARPASKEDENEHGRFRCILYRLSVPGGHQPDRKAAPAVHRRRHQEHRDGRPVRGHQDALWRAGQPGVPAAQLRQGGGRPVQGAGRDALPDRLQHPVSGQAEERAGTPGVRPAERLLAHDHRLPDPDRRRPAGHRRSGSAGAQRRILQDGQDRPGHHGRRRLYQPDPLQGPRVYRVRRRHQEHRHGLRQPRRQDGAAFLGQARRPAGAVPGLPPLRQGVRLGRHPLRRREQGRDRLRPVQGLRPLHRRVQL